ncbi:hypothetical protein [Paenibacillus sacheonensis]|uniref:Uncharacterized protein n=1 Tax=Paenibacillus sacheonensis TaxID=742054 RepID=A0A7X5BZH6_9BACL|nr:hypothetical protein [Paenibacillus sacheonensis]MBM7568932.1 putative membrane protein YqiK [Paenibacillus sacheonensis]NBC72693.1 hypothetical protein [Paenibacillus sacheonensis]
MVSPWITTAVILFGIIVAIAGVIAYLRMYKKSAWSAATTRPQEMDLPGADSAENDKI